MGERDTRAAKAAPPPGANGADAASGAAARRSAWLFSLKAALATVGAAS